MQLIATMVVVGAIGLGLLDWVQAGHRHRGEDGRLVHHQHAHFGEHHHGLAEWPGSGHHHGETAEGTEGDPTDEGEEREGSSELYLASIFLLTLGADAPEGPQVLDRVNDEPVSAGQIEVWSDVRHSPASLRGPPSA